MRSRSILAAVSLLALVAVAHANGPHDTPKRWKRPAATPRTTVSTSADLAVSGEARATSDAASAAEAAASSAQEQVASSASGGNSFATSSDVLALELPGHAGATAVDDCHVSRGSLGAFGIGSGGRVKFDDACVAHVRCLETAAALERLGHVDAAARVVVACAGVELPADVLEPVAPVVAVPVEVPLYVTEEQLRRAFEASQSK